MPYVGWSTINIETLMNKTGHLLSGYCQCWHPSFTTDPTSRSVTAWMRSCVRNCYFVTVNVERKSEKGERLRLRNWGMGRDRKASSIPLVPWPSFELASGKVRGRSSCNYSRGALRDLSKPGKEEEEAPSSHFCLPQHCSQALRTGNVGSTQTSQVGVQIRGYYCKAPGSHNAQGIQICRRT